MLLKPKISTESPRLFNGTLLEFLSRTHPSIVAILYMPLVTFLIWKSVFETNVGVWTTLGIMPLGMVAWTITEYWLHRVVMHCIPDFSWGKKLHFWVHEIHHKWPNDPYRLVMPLPISMALFVLFFSFFYATIGMYAWAFHAGFTLAYIMYDLIHFWLHHGKSDSQIFKLLQKHHLSHHFNPKYEDLHFAISVPFWDKLFGTDSPKKSIVNSKELSQTIQVSQSDSSNIRKAGSDDAIRRS